MKKTLMLIIGTLLSTGLAIAQTGGSSGSQTGGSTEGKPIHKADAASKDAHKGGKKTTKTKKGHKGGKKGTATTDVKPGGPGAPPPTRPPSNPQ